MPPDRCVESMQGDKIVVPLVKLPLHPLRIQRRAGGGNLTHEIVSADTVELFREPGIARSPHGVDQIGQPPAFGVRGRT